MFFSDMERKTLAITPLLLLSSLFFLLRGAGFGSSKAFHCLLLFSCLLFTSVNTLHNLAEYNTVAAKGFQGFNGRDSKGLTIQNVCPSSHFFSENQFDSVFTLFGLSCPKTNSVLLSNNLSGVVWLSLRPIHIIEFQPFTEFFHIGETNCYKLLCKEVYAKKNTRELSISVSGKHCGGNGYQCEGFSVETENSIKLLFLYQTDFDLELSWSSGVVVFTVPMKATAPVLMLKPVFWVRTKKLSIGVLIAAALLTLMFYFNDHLLDENNKRDNFSHIAVRKVEKPCTTITISPEMDSLLRSISKETLQGSCEVSGNNIKPMTPVSSSSCQTETSEGLNLKVETPSTITISPEMDSLLRSISKETLQGSCEVSGNNIKPMTPVSSSYCLAETSEGVNLTVKTVKDKKRRRNKKKKGTIRDVSSSHSENSTPRSPLSPKPQTTQDTTKPVKPLKPVLSHSATFPVTGVKSVILQGSTLAPNVRAPGAKSRTEAKEEYRYDIWGDHFTELHLMDRFKKVSGGKSSGFGEDESQSFFVKGPQSLLLDSRAKFVSLCNQWGS